MEELKGDKMQNEISLVEIIKVIIKQKRIISATLIIGFIISFAFYFAPNKEEYKAVGYYNVLPITHKIFLFFNLGKDKKESNQLLYEAKIKYPDAKIDYPLKNQKEANIISITTIGKTRKEAEEKCQEIIDTLPLKEILAIVSSKVIDPHKKRNTIATIVLLFMVSILSGFVKEWWNEKKEEL